MEEIELVAHGLPVLGGLPARRTCCASYEAHTHHTDCARILCIGCSQEKHHLCPRERGERTSSCGCLSIAHKWNRIPPAPDETDAHGSRAVFGTLAPNIPRDIAKEGAETKDTLAGGATRTKSTLRFDLIPACAERRQALRFGVGAAKHGENNWKQGNWEFVVSCYGHAKAHLNSMAEDAGNTKDDNLGAGLWNLAAMAWYEEEKPEEFKKAMEYLRTGIKPIFPTPGTVESWWRRRFNTKPTESPAGHQSPSTTQPSVHAPGARGAMHNEGTATKPEMRPEARYRKYTHYCRRIGVKPLDFEAWMKISDSSVQQHDLHTNSQETLYGIGGYRETQRVNERKHNVGKKSSTDA